MSRIVVDLVLDTHTGEARVVVDYVDASMTALELNEAIRDGEVREEVLGAVGRVLGEPVADAIRNGGIELVCLDDHPELRAQVEADTEQRREESERTPQRARSGAT